MNELLKIDTSDAERITVSARDLHEALEVKTQFKDWFPRMCEYGFEDGKDFCSFLSESTGGRPSQDAQITLDMAKEIAMLQRTEKGKCTSSIRFYRIMTIKKTDIQSLNYLALQALNDKQNEPEFKARFEEWKKKNGAPTPKDSAK